MRRTKGIPAGPSKLAAVPLAVAYAALPMAAAAAHLLNMTGPFPPALPWLVLAGLGTLLAMNRPRPDAPSQPHFLLNVFLFVLLVTILVLYKNDVGTIMRPLLPLLREASPLLLLLFAGLWATTCGLPDRADFQRYGGLLGAICLIDLAAEAAILRSIPAVRWIGNSDILAGLLLISLCAGLRPGTNDGGMNEPDQGRPLWRTLTMLGLLACLSRTGLFAGAWVVLCFGRGRLRMRTLFAILCGLLLAGTFLLPPTASDAIRYTDYWLWVEALRLYSETPLTLLTGFPLDLPLPVTFPAGMAGIWEAATGAPALLGVTLPQVPSFWLRLTLAWGLGAGLVVLVVTFVMMLKRLTRMGAGLTAALFAQGMSTPLLFDPGTCVAVGLAFGLAMSTQSINTRAHTAPEPTPDTDPEAGPDPVTQWDMRPL